MKLDKKERLQMSFTLKILEKLYPEDQDYYANHRKAIEDGYELHYEWITENLSDGLSKEECTEVLDILDMYAIMSYSFQKLDNPKNITLESFKFPGFDGNNETMHMAYTKYFIEDLNRFEEIQKSTNGYYNSHLRKLPKYRAMLKKWNEYDHLKRFELNEEELQNLLNINSY